MRFGAAEIAEPREYKCDGIFVAEHRIVDGCKTGKHVTCLTLMWFAEPSRYEEKWKGARETDWGNQVARRRNETANSRHCAVLFASLKRNVATKKKKVRARRWPLNATPKFSIRIHRQRCRIVSGGNAATRERRRKKGKVTCIHIHEILRITRQLCACWRFIPWESDKNVKI